MTSNLAYETEWRRRLSQQKKKQISWEKKYLTIMEYNKWTTLNCLTNELLNEFHFLAMCAVWNFFPSSMHHICIILWVISCSILLWLLLSFLLTTIFTDILTWKAKKWKKKSFGKRNTWCRSLLMMVMELENVPIPSRWCVDIVHDYTLNSIISCGTIFFSIKTA